MATATTPRLKARYDSEVKAKIMAGASLPTGGLTPSPKGAYNDPALATASRAALVTALGKDAVITPPALQMVSEDFAYYQKEIPGFYFFVGLRNEAKGITAMWHTEFYDMDEDALPVGVKAMATVALDFLQR